MEQKFCQSCGMPMGAEELYCMEADSSRSADYCKYYFDNGAFAFNGSRWLMIEVRTPVILDDVKRLIELRRKKQEDIQYGN